jgi:hypothetical protein
LRSTLHHLVPGITLLGLLLIASIGLRSLPALLLAILFLYGSGVVPIAATGVIAVLSFYYWRRNWLSGVSILCAAALVFALNVYPQPVTSPVGWAANGVKVLYYYRDLQHSYADAKSRGQTTPVGQVYTDGFGSLTAGLAYDPSGEIARPPDQRSRAWTEGPGKTELGIENLEAHHIWGAYYQWFHP